MSNTITINKTKEKIINQRRICRPVKKFDASSKVSPEELAVIESLFKYPSLEKVFDSRDAQKFPAIKHKMQSSVDELERIIRRGAKEDAADASVVAEAYRIVLNFLDELEAIRRQ